MADGLDAEALSLLRPQLDVCAILMVARVLWTGIVDILLTDGRLPQADGTGLFAVGIVVPRTTAVPRQLLVLAWEFDDDAEARQVGQTIRNIEGEGEFVAMLFGGHGDGQRVKSAACPVLSEPVVEALVVIGRSTENLRFEVIGKSER